MERKCRRRFNEFGAESGVRTRTPSRAADFKSAASACSATPAGAGASPGSGGGGAARGLDLSAIGTRLSAVELAQALVDPSAEVAPEYWIWTATMKNGQKLSGSRLNEDTFSLQVLDSTGKLRSVVKAELQEQTLEKRSPMPSFKDRLTSQQVDDLVAYLATLQGVAK